MTRQKVATAFALLPVLAFLVASDDPAHADPLARLHAGTGQWNASESAVVPASYTATDFALTSPPANTLPPPAEAWPTPGNAMPVGHEGAWGSQVTEAHVAEALCPCESIYRTEAWLFGVELLPTVSRVTVAQFGEWPDEIGTAVRLVLGYEDQRGIGMRLRSWSFGHTAATPADDVELAATTFNIDIYKRLFIADGEVVIGAGAAIADLSFELSNATESAFAGGGLSVFAEAWYPLLRYERTDIGTLIRARMTPAAGNWEDDTGFVIPGTNDDSMNIFEFAWGFEVRRRFGQCQDKYWYFTLLVENQTWDSAWMSVFTGTSVGFGGLSIGTGVAW